jgi:hypothetical protein
MNSNTEMQKGKVGTYRKLRLLYEQNINVNSISEELKTCRVTDDALIIKNTMQLLDYDVIGVEDEGIVIGYVMQNELAEGSCKDFYKNFRPTEIVSESTPLIQTLFILRETERIFILEGNRVTKVVTLADLQKPPIRMLLFGLISLLEMQLNRIIKNYFPNHSWKSHLSQKRMELTEALFFQRKSRNEAIELVDCLQICDKREIIVNDQKLRELTGIESKNKGMGFFKKLEELRNNLAHSQDINTQNTWNELFNLIEQTEVLLERCEKI